MASGSLRQTLRRLCGLGPTRPPYTHVVQLGDPALRAQALPVPLDELQSQHVQQVIRNMVTTLRRYKCVGLSAPQIGVPLRIIAVEVTKNHLRAHTPEQISARGMEAIPLRLLVNPQLSVEDHLTDQHPEMCASLRALSGLVERYRRVTVTAVSPSGEPVRWTADGWTARVLQHEMDHLSGTVFLDRCCSTTVVNEHWQLINQRAGRFRLLFDGFRNKQWGL